MQDLFEQNYKFSGENFPLGISAKRPQCSQLSISKGFIFADSTNFGSKMLGKIQVPKSKTLICHKLATIYIVFILNLQIIYIVVGIISNLEMILKYTGRCVYVISKYYTI